MRNYHIVTLFVLLALFCNIKSFAIEKKVLGATQWQGKKVGILGDSMSAPTDNPERKRFYSYLADSIGIEPLVYAVSGFQWKDLVGMAHRMRSDHGDNVDAILIWAGTNDYNASRPIGDFFTENTKEINVNGNMVQRKLTNFCNQNICLS